MNKKLNMLYWKGDKHWLGKLLEYPEIMTQGDSIEELKGNIKDAFYLMTMEDVPDDYQVLEMEL